MGWSALTLVVGLYVREWQEQAAAVRQKGSQELQCLSQCIIWNLDSDLPT